jgi:hypothetical protein
MNILIAAMVIVLAFVTTITTIYFSPQILTFIEGCGL